MKLADCYIGMRFISALRCPDVYRCTDIGTRVIVACGADEPISDTIEFVFDEAELPYCELEAI